MAINNTLQSPYKSFSSPLAGRPLSSSFSTPSTLLAPKPQTTPLVQPKAPIAPLGSISGTNLNNAVGNLNTATSSNPSIANSKTNITPSSGVTSDHITGLIKNFQGLTKTVGDYGANNPPVGSPMQQYGEQGTVGQGGNFVPAPTTPPSQFSGLVNTLATQQPSQQQTQAEQNLLSQNNSPQVIDEARATLAKQLGLDANTIQGIQSKAMPVEFQQGRAQVAQLAQHQKEAALEGVLGNLLTGRGQDITAQTSALGGANTQQQIRQQGLVSAAGLAAPQVTGYGQTSFNPTSGEFAGGGGAGGVAPGSSMDTALNQYAQMAANGQISAIPGSITSNPVLNAELNRRAQTINPNYNPITSAAQGSVASSNVQTAGTAGVTANQAVFNKAYGDYTTLQNAVQNVDQFGSLLTSGMSAPDGTQINPSNVKYANMKITDIRNQLSSGQQAQFDSTLAALQSKVSGLLSVGGNEIPTAVSSDARKIIDGSLPFGSLSAVLQRIQAEGNILLQNQAKLVNTSYSGIQSGGPNSSSSSGGPYDF